MKSIIEQVDLEIAKLQRVRTILTGESTAAKTVTPEIHLVPQTRHHKMSAEGRASISAAAKLRWKKKRVEEKRANKQAA